MSSHENFWSGKKSAAVLKHGVLANYLVPFATMTTSSRDDATAWFVDAYAGPGHYSTNGDSSSGSPGSPMIAMGTAEFVSKLQKPRTLNCVFIEQDPDHFTSLEKLVRLKRYSSDPHLMAGSAESHLRNAVQLAGDAPLLVFLDPYGTSLPYDLMKSAVLDRPSGATEVLLNFHVNSVARIGAYLGRPDELSESDLRIVAGLDELLGHDAWREVFMSEYRRNEEGSATRAALMVIDDFRDRVRAATGFDSFHVDIRSEEGHVPKFQLMLFFKEGVAAYKFADAASTGNAQWREFNMKRQARENGVKYEGALFGVDFTEETFADKWKRDEASLRQHLELTIAVNIRAALAGRAFLKLDNNDHLREIFGTVLGLAGEKHLKMAWDRLASEGLVAPRNKSNKQMYYARIERRSASA